MPPNQLLKNKLLNSALRLLKYRSRSQQEIATHLSRQTSNQKLVSNVIDQLIDLNLIDDKKFASWLIISRLRQNKGQKIINFDLKRFGVRSSLATEALSITPPTDFINSAKTFLEKKQTLINKLPKHQRRYKARQLLYQRGFSQQTSISAIDEMSL